MRLRARPKTVAFAAVAALAVAACSSSGSSSEETTTTAAEETTTTVEEAAAPALAMGEGTAFLIDWSALSSPAFFSFMDGESPFWFIHTEEPEGEGFFSLEMYTTGYGPTWTGELGTFDIDCSEGGTGICVHLVKPGTDTDLGADFAVTGTVTINQLDEAGYDLVVDATFSDGTTISGLEISG